MASPRDDNDTGWTERERTSSIAERITLLVERQQQNIHRIEELEKKQAEYDKLLNRGLGAIGLVAALGVFLSWLFSIGSNIFEMFHR